MSQAWEWGCGPYKIQDENKEKHSREYSLWNSMKMRATPGRIQEKYPTYRDCTASPEFMNGQSFSECINSKIGFTTLDANGKAYHLDKDILVRGNKHYADDLICFLPQEINCLLTKSNSTRGEFPLGVNYVASRGRYYARVHMHGKVRHIGCFGNAADAFHAYKVRKELYIKEIAEKYKDTIEPRAFSALMEYEVSIND